MGIFLLILLMQSPQRYIYTGGFFVFSHGDTLKTDKVILVVDGKVKNLEEHPAVKSIQVKGDRVTIYLKKGKVLIEKDLSKYVKGKIKRIEVIRKPRKNRPVHREREGTK